MTARRKAVTLGAVVLVLWIVGIAVWASRPLNDSVPVGINYNLETPREVSQDVSCNSLFASDARPDEPLPVLEAQPPAAPQPLAYQRTPCAIVQDHARVLFGLNAALIAIVLVGGGLLLWRHRSDGDDLPAVVTA